jgi:alkylated DNA repair dioxygenase AlkB
MLMYLENYSNLSENQLRDEIAWWKRTETRMEYFMADSKLSYSYGEGRGVREYFSEPYHPIVKQLQDKLNTEFGAAYNVCFLNRYDNQKNHLGWHADDSAAVDMDHPIAVVSVGAEREIWVRENGAVGVTPMKDRYLLRSNSLFIMPAGYQATHQHRIPKCDRECGMRISLTFRRYV